MCEEEEENMSLFEACQPIWDSSPTIYKMWRIIPISWFVEMIERHLVWKVLIWDLGESHIGHFPHLLNLCPNLGLMCKNLGLQCDIFISGLPTGRVTRWTYSGC